MHVETVTVGWLTTRFPSPIRVVTETPAEMTGQIIRVTGLPGGQKLSLGRPMVDVECFAGTRVDARTLAMQVHNALLFEMRGLVGDALVTTVKTAASPSWRPYDNASMRRFGATYQMYLHPAA